MGTDTPLSPDASPTFLQRAWERISPLIQIGIPSVFFAVVLVVLYRVLLEYSYAEVVADLKSISSLKLGTAVLLCVLNYLVLTGYDVLAVRYVGVVLPFSKIGFASFVSYTVSQNVGVAVLSGGAVRYRFYSRWGVPAGDIARIIAFTSFHFWTGLFLLAGLVCVSVPSDFTAALHMSEPWTRLLGAILLVPIVVYLWASSQKRRSMSFSNWDLPVPEFRIALLALLVASLDWLLAASTLYVLLPGDHQVSYLHGISAFFAAQFAGVLSHVPGGLGVFETVMVLLVSPDHRGSAIVGALILFRFLYYFIPFTLALVALLAYEARRHKEKGRDLIERMRPMQRVVAATAPTLLSVAVFLAGIVLLFSGASPTADNRLWWVTDVMPVSFIEMSHFVNSVVGTLLLSLSFAIRRKLYNAYWYSLILLLVGVVVSLVKGLDYEEGGYLLLTILGLYLSRESFYRKSISILELQPVHLLVVGMGIVGSVWLGLFSYKHVDYANELWWRFASDSDAPRFLRSTVTSSVVLVWLGFRTLLMPLRYTPHLATEDEIASAKSVIQIQASTVGNLALLGDKSLLFDEKKNAFVMYRVSGRSWISMGDPVGPENEASELIWEFRELSDQHGGYCVFYEASANLLPSYLDVGLEPLKLGESASVRLSNFSLEGAAGRDFRSTVRKLENLGLTFEVAPVEEIDRLLPQLAAVSDDWLESRNTKEKSFSLGYFDENYLRQGPCALIRHGEEILAFANIWSNQGREELSIDLMRHTRDAPSSTMEFLFVRLMLWGKGQGYGRFDLGMAPLSGFETRRLAPLWSRLGSYLYRYGEHFYNFEGLRRYKEKFHPEWEPRYLISPGGLRLPTVLANVTTLISGGIRGLIGK